MTALAIAPIEARIAGDVTAAAGGDRDAFARLIAASSGVVCAVALAITRDVSASEDVAQDVFLAAWTGLPRLQDPASFLPWIRQIARFRARSWLRERATRRGGADALTTLRDPAPSSEQRLLDDEERRAFDDAFAALPDDAREVVTLYYREGASTAQLAELLGVGEAAVRQRLSRVRAELRAEVLARLGESLRKTGPGAAFTAGVLALTLTAPSSATAATATAVAGKSGLATKLLAAGGAAGFGLFLGVLGVVLGVRRQLRAAIDDDERRALVRFGWIASAVTASAALGFALAATFASVAIGFATQAWFGSSMMVLYWWRLPRITARRDAIQIAAGPREARRLHVRRIMSRVVFVLAFIVSTLSLLYGLHLRGLL